ncbi:hypothetical protein [Nakamurella lactea]|uniref:hypothetical protein n=1 Tax=Nakamurella lactea TaxID=459515 RepID=UPI0004090A41|nr:hypothetical protein [Nakamurella lactea]
MTRDQITFDWAILRAATMFRTAETETDRELMRLFMELGGYFVGLADTLKES